MKLIPSYCRRLFRTAFITRNSIVPGSLNHLGFICKAWKDDPILHLSLSFRHFHSSQWNIFHHHYHFIYSQSLLCASSSLSGFRRNFTLSWEYFLPVSLSSLDILHIMLFFFFLFKPSALQRNYLRHALLTLFFILTSKPFPFFSSNTTALLRCMTSHLHTKFCNCKHLQSLH